MSRALALVGLPLLLAGCASAPVVSERSEVLRRVVASTVQIRAEWPTGVRRSASGVIVASDGATKRSWILTARHLLDPPGVPRIYVSTSGRRQKFSASVKAKSDNSDLALLEVTGAALTPVRVRPLAQLGDEVWVVGFPLGRRLTVVSGVVSQILAEDGEVAMEGSPRMVDAAASYGSSGGGVFDAVSGELIAIVEGYTTVRVTIDKSPERTVDLPTPGETTIIGGSVIRRFLRQTGIGFPGQF